MSAIADYSSLLIDVGEYAGRNDIAHLFPRFIGLAEAKFNRVLRVADMETAGTVTLVDGDGDLPTDFLEAREVLTPMGCAISAWSLSALTAKFRNYGGYPQGYVVVGNVIKARPTTDGTLTLTYYASIPTLTPAAPTNWLLTKAPDVYLYALCEEIAIWQKDINAVGSVRPLKEQAMRGLALQDERSRWGNSQVVLGTITP